MSDPLSIATGLITLIQLTAKVTEYVKDVKDGGKERTKLRDELRSVTCLLEMLLDRVEDQHDSDDVNDSSNLKPAAIASLAGPDGPLDRMKTTMEKIVSKLAPSSGLRKLAQPIKWPFDKKDVLELLGTMERLKSHFTLVLQNDLMALSKLVNQKVDLVSKQLDDMDLEKRDNQAEKILSWICSASFQAQQADVLRSVQPGTGKWFLGAESFCDWLIGDVSLLWCPGIPGAGKTRLASLAVNSVETLHMEPGNTLAYIYYDHNRRESQTTQTLVSSILEQALRRASRSSLPDVVASLYTKHSQQGTRPTPSQLSVVFRQVFSSYNNVFVVVDALDECAPSDEAALEFIKIVRELGSNIRLLVTSRNSTNFEGYFKGGARIDVVAQDEDIELYLETEIPKQSRLVKHIRADPCLQEDIIKDIVKSAQGMFLLATLNLTSLSRKLTRREVRSSLSTLPKTLDATYEDALARIRSQAEDDVEVAQTIIMWVLCAQRPLSVLELQHMYAVHLLAHDDEYEPICLEDDDLPPGDIVTGVCGGLIVVDGTLNTVRLVHYTAHDYLLRTHGGELHKPRLELAKVSLIYLQLLNFSDGPGLSDDIMAERLAKFPFLEYAAHYWGQEIGEVQMETFCEHINRFLSNAVAVSVASQVWSLPRHRFMNWSLEFPTNVPALVLVASFPLPKVIERLVAQGHNIEGSGSDGETPLIRSARLGHAENIRTLLRLGADITAADVTGETSIERATLPGNAYAVKALIVDGKADVNIITGSTGWSLLMSAVSSGSIETVRLLIEAGADLHGQTSWGETALSLASIIGREAIANLLIDAGAILPPNRASRRATLQAAKRGLMTLASRLTSFGGDYDTVVDTGLQREPVAVGRQLAYIAELDEAETEAKSQQRTVRESQQDPATTEPETDFNLMVALEGIRYRQGFLRRYNIVEKLGKGHFATVFLCTSKITNVAYAVKKFEFHPNRALNAQVEGFRDEIKCLNAVRHPNIIGLIDTLVSDTMDALFLVLELMQEGELFNMIVFKQKLSEDETRTVFRQLFSALDYLHREGWAHRDIKPENILMCGDLNIKLADFGMAVKLRDQPEEMDDMLCGTPSYVAPEILVDGIERHYSYPIDVWSAGVVLYICLCGFPPFSDELYSNDFPYTLAQQIKEGRFDFPSPYWDPVGDPALALIDSMLIVDSKKRFVVEQCQSHPWMLAGDAEVPHRPEDGAKDDSPGKAAVHDPSSSREKPRHA